MKHQVHNKKTRKTGMIKICFNERCFELQKKSIELTGSFDIDEGWRDNDYVNGDSFLALNLTVVYEVPVRYLKAFDERGFINLDAIKDPAIRKTPNQFCLNFSITHVEFDSKVKKLIRLSDVPYFPTEKDFKCKTIKKSEAASSYVWLPCFSKPAVLGEIKFDTRDDGLVEIFTTGKRADLSGACSFSFDEKAVPFVIEGNIKGYAGEFPNLSDKERVKELKNCLETLYDLTKYDIEISVNEADIKSSIPSTTAVNIKLKSKRN